MAPDNRITPLLPVWPTAPLKEFEGRTRRRNVAPQEPRRKGRKDAAGNDKKGKPHIDTYA